MSLNASTAVSTIQAPVAVDRVAVSVIAVPGSVQANPIPVVAEPARQAATDIAPQPAQLAQAVDDLNKRFKDSHTDLRFSIDEDSGRTVVAVIDAENGAVLRQMPTEEALRVSKALDEALGTLIQRVA